VRRLSILLLVALLFDILVLHPFAISMKYDGDSSIVMLDVCHAPANGLIDDDEMPGLIGEPHAATPTLSFNYGDMVNFVFVQLLLTVRNERPPNA
jgi:hypothetical protein